MKKNRIAPLAGMALAVCGLTINPQQSSAVSNNVTNTQKDSVATCQGDFLRSMATLTQLEQLP